MSYVRTAAALVADPSAAGGKARGLLTLVAAGLPVPPFVVITADAWRDGGAGTALPRGLDVELAVALAPFGDAALAVRSSALVEDGGDASWAGQFETVLGVRGLEAVQGAILRCWAAGRSERARAYGAATGVDPGAIAIIVQVMAVGRVSGVMFGRDPDRPDQALISVGLGLGEGVVQGRVPCDTFRVDERDRVERTIEAKDEEVVLGDDGPIARPVTDARRDDPAISDAIAIELAHGARALERRTGRPVDVEFTVDGDRVVWLQVRPIAVPIPGGRRLLWDNSNIVESYSGLTTPLTFSFASRAYTIAYQLFCRVMGVDEETIRHNEPVFRRMIGLVRGRIYYNLNSWYRVLQLLPGFSFNREAMETMMGVSEVASDEDAGPPPPRWQEGMSLGRLGARLGWRLWTLERDAAAFQELFRVTLARCNALDLGAMRPDELLAVYEEVERELLWAWTPPLVNDFFCMIFYRMLQKRCQEASGDPATVLHNRLLAGEGQLASAAPALELVALAGFIAADPVLRELFGSRRTDREVFDAAIALPAFHLRFEAWMSTFGDRSPDELKLESATLRDTPEFVIATLRAWVVRPDAVRKFGADETAAREAAEVEVYGKLRGPLRRATFGFVLRQARRRVALRESLRFERTRIFGFVRNLFRALGNRYVDAGMLDTRDDVFYLTVDEVLGVVRGTASSVDLRGLVGIRRAEFAGYAASDAPAERFHTWGAVHVHNRFRGKPVPKPVFGEFLDGTACSPGRVTAVAKVVRDPRECPDLGGAVLVAHRTDPGWVPLYPTASAIVVERGSVLSHSAVVARELGLPAVVGCKGLLDWVRDGETITVDGSTGRIPRGQG